MVKTMFFDASEKRVFRLLKRGDRIGISITEIVEKTNLSRSCVRISLAKLEGAGLVYYRKIGMAKVYYLKSREAR